MALLELAPEGSGIIVSAGASLELDIAGAGEFLVLDAAGSSLVLDRTSLEIGEAGISLEIDGKV